MLPSTKTFGTPELLETILEYATPRDLLLWQRVNKKWQAAIQRSRRIQEKLFYRPIFCRDPPWHEKRPVIWNPFIDLFSTDSGAYDPNQRYFTIDAFDGKASHPTASWRQILMTSPTTTEMKVVLMIRPKGIYIWPLDCENGVTMGELADTVKEMYCRRDDGSEVEGFFASRIY